MPSYGFSFRASTRKGGDAGRIYLRVVHGGESRSVTTSYRILPEEWDATGRRLIIPYGRSERSRQLIEMENSMLCDLRRMESVIRKLEHDDFYTIDEIMERYRAIMTGNQLAVYTDRLATEMENSGYYRTAKAYRTATARLIEFSGNKNLSHENITPELIAGFQQALKAEGRSMNTVSFYMRTLRAIYHKAIAEGRIVRRVENLFGSVYTGVSATRKLALSQGELAMLSAFDPTEVSVVRTKHRELPHHMAQALAMFLFCYHARGMCFIDMAYLQKSNLKGNTIRYHRKKTGQEIVLHVLPAMRRIIDWFAPQTTGSKFIFPVLTDPDKDINLQYESGLRLQNKRLKQLALRCGITKRFSTHAARHSWATVARNTGLPLSVISEGLGHSSQRTTEIYLASLEQSVLNHASRLVSEAITPGLRSKKGHSSAKGGAGGLPGYRMPGGFQHAGRYHRLG